MAVEAAIDIRGGAAFRRRRRTACLRDDLGAARRLVAVIDTETKRVIADHPVAGTATDVAVSPDGTRIFVGQAEQDSVGLAVINTFGRIHTIDLDGVGRTVDAVRVSPNGRLVYVATSDADSGKLLVVDVVEGRVIRDVPVASPISDLALSHDGALAYVARFDTHWGGSVDVIDTAINEITAKVGIGVRRCRWRSAPMAPASTSPTTSTSPCCAPRPTRSSTC